MRKGAAGVKAAAGAVTRGATGVIGRLRGSGRQAGADERVIPAFVDPDEQERLQEAERLREWPDEDLDEMPTLNDYFGYTHIENGDRLVRSDGRRMAVFQVKGKEIDHPSVASFAGALNSLQGHVQFLIRQHSPRLNEFRAKMRAQRGGGLSERLVEAAESLDILLGDKEDEEGLMDRRFYIVCDDERMDDVMAAISRVQLTAGILTDRALNIFLLSCAFGQSPADLPEKQTLRYRTEATHVRSDNGDYRRTMWLKVFPRIMTVGLLGVHPYYGHPYGPVCSCVADTIRACAVQPAEPAYEDAGVGNHPDEAEGHRR